MLSILDRDNEAELVAIATASRFKIFQIGRVGVGSVGLPALAIASHTVALYVAQMGGNGVRASLLQHDIARFDHYTAGAGARHLAGHASRNTSAAEGRRWSCT